MRSKFLLHDLVVVTEPIIIEPCNTLIEKGAKGKIIDIDPDTKDFTIRLSDYHPDLSCRNNFIWLAARDAHKIKLARPRPYTFKKAVSLIIGTGLACTTLMIVADRLNDDMVISTMAALHDSTISTLHDPTAIAPLGCAITPHDGKPIRQRDVYSVKLTAADILQDLLNTER